MLENLDHATVAFNFLKVRTHTDVNFLFEKTLSDVHGSIQCT